MVMVQSFTWETLPVYDQNIWLHVLCGFHHIRKPGLRQDEQVLGRYTQTLCPKL